MKLGHRAPWVEPQGYQILEEFCLEEQRFVTVDVVRPAP